VAKLLYKPLALIGSLIAARLGKTMFKRLWARVDDAEPPAPSTEEASVQKVVGAAVLEAATMAGIAAAVDRATARLFQYLTGLWPGKHEQEEEEKEA
jgi:Protein of unknown function (DUF4235)